MQESNKNESGIPRIPQFPHLGNCEDINTPTFGEYVYQNLPEPLNRICSAFKNKRERDIILLGAITTIGALMHNVFGYYRRNKCYPNLFSFIVAPSASGKGELNYCRSIAEPVHNLFRETPVNDEPNSPKKMFLLPGNTSSTGIYQLLDENNGVGLLIETEGDTLSNSFKQDFGDFSSGLREAFQHEPISYNRRGENERVEITHPRISVLLSGTPFQVKSLIPSTENGLFSRFLYYKYESESTFDDVFGDDELDLKGHFLQVGNELFQNYSINKEEIRFTLTRQQQKDLVFYFKGIINDIPTPLKKNNFASVVRRMGLMNFRIAMVLSYVRNLGETESLECSDADYEVARSIVSVLLHHSVSVMELLPNNDIGRQAPKNEQVIIAMNDSFSRQDILFKAEELGIPRKTIEGYVGRLVDKGKLNRPKQGHYEKVNGYFKE